MPANIQLAFRQFLEIFTAVVNQEDIPLKLNPNFVTHKSNIPLIDKEAENTIYERMFKFSKLTDEVYKKDKKTIKDREYLIIELQEQIKILTGILISEMSDIKEIHGQIEALSSKLDELKSE
ncbi:MAG: hypothetical protein IPO21_04575 [Bacteroidales bacterium]|nr:hypothetical protein [Bacteroidales bacterium]